MLGNNMFAYCRNNPVCRVDISGAMDADSYDNDPLDQEDLLKAGEPKAGNSSNESVSSGGTANGSSSGSSGQVSISQQALNTLNYIQANNGSAPPGYHSGSYANDGRGGTTTLPQDAPYYEYDIYPYIPGVNRGGERIVIGGSGTAWYTPDHYITFIRME